MEPLSPRSTNILPKPKPTKSHSEPTKQQPRMTADTKQQQQAQPRKERAHAPKDYAEPPAEIREPGRGGETYVRGEFLGKGGFAVCYEGSLMRNGRVLAMKGVKSEMAQKKMAEKVGDSLLRTGV